MKKNYEKPMMSIEQMENNSFVCTSSIGRRENAVAGSNERRTGWDTVFGED